VEDVAKQYGATVVRAPVGERHVVEGMRARGAIIGGEGNGGVIFPQSHEGRDSLVGIALVLDLLARRHGTLSALVAELPRYVMTKEKFPHGTSAFDSAALAHLFQRTFPDAQCNSEDGVRMDTADGWIHLRPSNTEPVIRLIAEARTEAALERMRATVRHALTVPA
jgi:phosphomannomutase